MSWWKKTPAAQVEDNDPVEMPPVPGASQAATHPSLAILQAAGINSEDQLTETIAAARAHKEYQVSAIAALREAVKKKAVIALGQTEGAKMAADIAAMDTPTLSAMDKAYDALASRQFGYAADGTAPPRGSAPQTLPSSTSTEGTPEDSEKAAAAAVEEEKKRLLGMTPAGKKVLAAQSAK